MLGQQLLVCFTEVVVLLYCIIAMKNGKSKLQARSFSEATGCLDAAKEIKFKQFYGSDV